jgi:hypothetical protein
MNHYYNFTDTTFNVKELLDVSPSENDRVDVTFFAKANSKNDFIRKLCTLQFLEGSRSWINDRACEGTSEFIQDTIKDDESIYVELDKGSLLIGKYTPEGKWEPINPPIECIHNKELSKFVVQPSFGMIGISKVSSSGSMNLFGSSVKSKTFISLDIHRAKLNRNLHQDTVYTDGVPLISVNLSLTQFAELMTSPNSQGVPCTIDYFEGRKVPEPILESKRVQFDDEFKENMQKVTSGTNKFYTKIKEILETSSISKRDKTELIKQIDMIRQELNSNIPFIKVQFTEQMNQTVLEAKNEIMGFLEERLKKLGLEKFRDQLALEFTGDKKPIENKDS